MRYPFTLGVSAVFRFFYNTVFDTIYEICAGKDEVVAIMPIKEKKSHGDEVGDGPDTPRF